MDTQPHPSLQDLPDPVQRVLGDFVEAAKAACGDTLRSVVLYGSAAEGSLRPTSDVNLLLLLKEFKPTQVDRLREKLRVARAAIQLEVMFLLESELSLATESFAVKFADIAHRHRVLHGADPLRGLHVSRTALVQRLRQVTLNSLLRLRERYAMVSLREEQLAFVVADVAGPLRSSAATMLELECKPVASPKAALQQLAQELGGSKWDRALVRLSEARETRALEPGEGPQTLWSLLELLEAMNLRAQALR